MPPLSSNCVPDVEKDDAWSGFVGDMSELRRQSERAVVVRGHVDFCVSNPYCYPKTLCWLDSCRLYNRSSCDQLAHLVALQICYSTRPKMKKWEIGNRLRVSRRQPPQ